MNITEDQPDDHVPQQTVQMPHGDDWNIVDPELLQNAVDISPDKNRGVLKHILLEGRGDEHPYEGDYATVKYKASLCNGNPFDSTANGEKTITTKLGDSLFHKGWDIAVLSMKKGEKSRFVIRSDFGYGVKPRMSKVPPGANLIYDIQLLSWKGEDISEEQTGALLLQRVQKTRGYRFPHEESKVTVHLQGKYNGEIFDDRTVTYVMGEAFKADVVDGIDIALRKLSEGEVVLLTLASPYAFGENSFKDRVPPRATVKYQVTLEKIFKAGKEIWEMNPTEKLNRAKQLNKRGGDFFKEGRYRLAMRNYKAMDDFLSDEDFKDEHKTDAGKLLIGSLCNISLCYLKLGLWAHTKRQCSTALEKDSSCEKALYRRGQAYMETKDWEDALNDFKSILRINSSNSKARKQLNYVEEKLREHKEKNLLTFRGMFDLFAQQDDRKHAIEKAKGIKLEEPIGYWSNDMAEGMMSLQQEMEAFGEHMPDQPLLSGPVDDGDPSERQG